MVKKATLKNSKRYRQLIDDEEFHFFQIEHPSMVFWSGYVWPYLEAMCVTGKKPEEYESARREKEEDNRRDIPIRPFVIVPGEEEGYLYPTDTELNRLQKAFDASTRVIVLRRTSECTKKILVDIEFYGKGNQPPHFKLESCVERIGVRYIREVKEIGT